MRQVGEKNSDWDKHGETYFILRKGRQTETEGDKDGTEMKSRDKITCFAIEKAIHLAAIWETKGTLVPFGHRIPSEAQAPMDSAFVMLGCCSQSFKRSK